MKLQRKYILQYLCILVLAAIGVMNIIEADYLRALTSAIYVFICVQVVVAGYRFVDLGRLLDIANNANKELHDELDEVYEERDKAIRRRQELECSSEHSRQDSLRWRDEKNKIEKECNRLRQENRHLTAEIERLNHSLFANRWKPSDEQMLALEAKITIPPQSPDMTSALIELYEQLKKLRDE